MTLLFVSPMAPRSGAPLAAHGLLSRKAPFPAVVLEAAVAALSRVCLMDGGGFPDVLIDGIALQLLASMERAVAAGARGG
jgi:hypothetical protein